MLSSVKPNAIKFAAYAVSIMKLQIPVIACLLAALPAAALADSHTDHTSSSRPSAPARSSYQQPSRSYQQAPRDSQQAAPRYSQQAAPRYSQQAAPRYSQQAAPRYSQQAAPRYSQQAAPRYSQPAQRYTQPEQRYTQPAQRYQSRNAYAYGGSGYIGRRNVNPWYWNRGNAWVASPAYWGGGFWGAFSIGLGVNTGGYYAVQADSPGSQLLANYGLQQTDCNQPNLVDISGPDGSEICAYPNNEVGPGQYQIDPSTLSLVSAQQ
jgi:hypothetical protein